jgi:hypothetical protein
MIVTLRTHSVAYHHAKSDRIATTVTSDGVTRTITTRPLPMKFEGIYTIEEADQPTAYVRLSLVVGLFGSEAGGDLRAGVLSAHLEQFAEGEVPTPAPLRSGVVRAISVHDAACMALAGWSYADDGSEVTPGRARAFLRRSVLAEEVDQRWRRASRAYLEAKANGQQTTPAVIRELGLLPNQDSAARQVIYRAGIDGVLEEVAAELGLEHLLTKGQRPSRKAADR